ncbi:metallophosphoesterase [Nocardioides sp.]|uniref:metallophosphoesterase family protein n=1 Tax=Nocardioides sp. TaxID=35761 RepID=UPI002611C5C4|nr:metallophosphoesterase [Nocardioides sp.]MDI6911857.1 metallophosphoesterase [Nocardioides sp.]
METTHRAARTLLTAVAGVGVGVASLLAAAVTVGADASPYESTVRAASTSSATSVGATEAPARPEGPADYTFLSSPDFMNSDLADVSKLRTWHRGMPNSWNSSYATTIDTILDGFESERPDDVFVAGDLVDGHWASDDDRTGIFGPTRTYAERKAALKRAADFYFSEWRKRFDRRDLPVYAAVGDHDIGDNPWRGGDDLAKTSLKRNSFNVFKRSFYKHVLAPNRVAERPHGAAHDTAYAKYVSPEVLLVTVDVFQRTGGNVIAKLDRNQLKWLNRTLAAAERRGTDWIVVQGHTPVIRPVRTYGSSALYYKGGATSPFWRTMARHHVDLYLNGEVHTVSVRRADGITQVSHGGTVQMASTKGEGSTNYLLGEVFGDTMWLRDNRFAPRAVDFSRELWQYERGHRPVIRKVVRDPAQPIGHLVLTSDNQLVHSDGMLTPLTFS